MFHTAARVLQRFSQTQEFTFNGAGTFKLNDKTIVSLATSVTVTNTSDGLTIGENTFALMGDDEFTLKVDAGGNIVSSSGIDSG